jgi:hypothetical protein
MSDKPVIAAPEDQLFGEHRDTEEIRKDIHEAAADVAETLDALQAKLTPDVVMEEAKHIAVSKIDDAKDYVLAKAKQYPNATTLLALGTLWVVGRNLFGQGRGSGVVSLVLGASIGVVVYRTMNGTLMPRPKQRPPRAIPSAEKDIGLGGAPFPQLASLE